MSNTFCRCLCKYVKLCRVVALTYWNLLRAQVPQRSRGTRPSRLTKIINLETFLGFGSNFLCHFWMLEKSIFWASLVVCPPSLQNLDQPLQKLGTDNVLTFLTLRTDMPDACGPQIDIQNWWQAIKVQIGIFVTYCYSNHHIYGKKSEVII